MSGVVMSPEFNEQVKQTVREVLRQLHSTGSHSGRWSGSKNSSRWAITNAAISAPSNGVTTPTTGQIEFLDVSSSGDLVRSGDTVTLTHRWEGITLESGTLLRVVNDWDEWIAVAADCEALGSPPS